MQPPQWERGDAFSSPLVQRRRETTLPPAETTGMPCGARPQLPCGKSPVAPLASPILGSEQSWLDPGMASVLRSSLCSCCDPSSQSSLLDAPRSSRMCQMLFAGKGAMLVITGAAVPSAGLELSLGSCSAPPSPAAPGPCLPMVRAEPASQPSAPSPEICPWASSPSLQPQSVHMDKPDFFSCFCEFDPHGSSWTGR